MFRSLRARLTLAYSLTFSLVLVLFCASVYVVHGRHLQHDLDTALQAIARSQSIVVAGSVAVASHLHGPAGNLTSPSPATHYQIQRQIVDSAGKIVAVSSEMQRSPLLVDKVLLNQSRFEEKFGYVHHQGRNYRVLSTPFREFNGRSYQFVVSADLENLVAMQRQLLAQLILIGILSLAVITVIGWLLSGWVAWPIARIASAAQEISDHNLQHRIPVMPAAEELRRLIAVLNQTFDRLALAIDNQRRFIGDASHELRSPLANLRSELEVALRRDRAAQEYREVLASGVEEVGRLTKLTDDLLLLSTGDQGRLVLNREPIDLDELMTETAERFRPRAAAKGLAIEMDLHLPDTVIPADRHRLRQILDNLVENAIRYSPAGKVIRVVTQPNGRAVQVQVRDEGIGIPPEEQPHIFDRFYRTDKARSRQQGGTGLGLSICKLLVDLHGGTISVASAVGQGSTFTVKLPVSST